MTKGRFEILGGFPADVLAVEASGEIDHDAYAEALIPAVEAKRAEQGRLKLLYVIGEEFEGYTAGAMLEDAKLGFLHLSDFARIAVVTDVEWIRAGVRIFAPLITAPVRTFPLEASAEAKDWICADAPRGDRPIGADAEERIPPLEDKLPPAR